MKRPNREAALSVFSTYCLLHDDGGEDVLEATGPVGAVAMAVDIDDARAGEARVAGAEAGVRVGAGVVVRRGVTPLRRPYISRRLRFDIVTRWRVWGAWTTLLYILVVQASSGARPRTAVCCAEGAPMCSLWARHATYGPWSRPRAWKRNCGRAS